jgi:hypothetical protein
MKGKLQLLAMQTPWSHNGAEAGQAFPQTPQLRGSELRKVQFPLQRTAPSKQV